MADERTDGQTQGHTIYRASTALRGKKAIDGERCSNIQETCKTWRKTSKGD